MAVQAKARLPVYVLITLVVKKEPIIGSSRFFEGV